MPATSLHSMRAQYGPYDVFVGADGGVPAPLDPGERVGGPVARRRMRWSRVAIVAMLIGVGAWAWSDRQDDLMAFASYASGMIQDLQARQSTAAQPAEPRKTAEPLPSTERSLEERALATAARPPETAPVVLPEPGATQGPADDAPVQPRSVERLPEVVADPSDALQQKALAAGLHPALSRALLDQLTAEDFRNAARAVQMAIGLKVVTETILWPRKRTSAQAQFKVKLVDGAPAECRRYVVQIARDGWETTARPMEKCAAVRVAKPS